jgi:putative toxin-antitoxin system antitoxin component (TIGR02293 family)
MAGTSSNAARSGSATGSLGIGAGDVLDIVGTLKSGLPFHRLASMARVSGLSVKEIAAVLGTPPRTLARRKAHGNLSGGESERLLRLARLFDLAVNLFEGDAAAARAWLRRPAKALAGRTPLQLAQSEIGARAVEDLIGRLEYGIFT